MSLETLITNLTAALEANTAALQALKGGALGGTVAEPAGDKAGKNDGGDDAPKIAPTVAKYAEENGIDPATVEGTGKNGSITKKDINNAIAARGAEDDGGNDDGGDDDDWLTGGDDDGADDTPDEPEPATLDQARDAIMSVAQGVSRERAKELVAEFNAEKLGEIEESDYGAVVARAAEILEEEG